MKPKSEEYTTDQRIADLKNICDIQCNNVVDEYMRGMANGLLLAEAIMSKPYGSEVNYFDASGVQQINDRD